MRFLLFLIFTLMFQYIEAQDTIVYNQNIQLQWMISDLDLHYTLKNKEDSLKYLTIYKSFKTNIPNLYFVKGYYSLSGILKIEGFSLSVKEKQKKIKCKNCYSYRRVGIWKYYTIDGNLSKMVSYDER